MVTTKKRRGASGARNAAHGAAHSERGGERKRGTKAASKPAARQARLQAYRTEVEAFRARVHYLIGRYEEGNVTQAARRVGVSQRAMLKVSTGQTQAPRLDFLLGLIAAYPAEDPLWILTGKRSGDEQRLDAMAQAAALRMLRERGTPERDHAVAARRPTHIDRVAESAALRRKHG